MVRRMVLLLAAAMLAVIMVAGTALAAPGNNGRGAAHAAPQASFGITTAVAASGGCGLACGS